VILHINSDAGGEMPIEVLDHVGIFMGYFLSYLLETHYRLTAGPGPFTKSTLLWRPNKRATKSKTFFARVK
jgi:hypothetical protein